MLAPKQAVSLSRSRDAHPVLSAPRGCQVTSIKVINRVQARQPVASLVTGAETLRQDAKQRLTTSPRKSVRTSAAADGAFSGGAQPQADDSKCSFTQAVFNVVNVVMGVGVLSVPFALNSSGWAGIGYLVFMGYVAAYSGKALVECSNAIVARSQIPNKISAGYEEIGEAAYGKLGRLICSSMIYFELSGCCAMMFILMGDNMFNILGTALAKTQSEYMLLGALLIIPTMWLPDLKALSFLGLVGLGVTVSVATAILFTLVSGNFAAGAVTNLVMWDTFPMVLGILTFVYSGHGVFPSIQAAMQEPKQFPQVLNVAYAIVASICVLIGSAGYYMYGKAAADIVVFNLPTGFLLTFCSALILITPIAKFAVTLEPVANALMKTITGGGSLKGFERSAMRTVLAIAILFAARSVPMLALVMALLGSFLTISISITLPSLCKLSILKDELSAGQKAWDLFIVALGLICTTLGTFASLQNIMRKISGA